MAKLWSADGSLPQRDLVLRNARVPLCLLPGFTGLADQDGLVAADLAIRAGKITAVQTASATPISQGETDLDRGMVLPCFVEAHTHLDKGHIWPRRRNPDGTFMGALDNVGLDREAHWSAADLRARMEFALKSAYAHGTSAIRTHLDSIGAQVAISWNLFADIREEWSDRIALQASGLFGIEYAEDEAAIRVLAKTISKVGGQMGGVPYMMPNLAELLDRVIRLAMDHGLDLDFHVDETQDPTSEGLEATLDAMKRNGYRGKLLVGHCCSLARQSPETQKRVTAKLFEAGAAVVSLPMCNLYLQDRAAPSRTPLYRGVTLLHELKAAGVPVMVSSDNTRDPFYAYGDLDGLEVFREAVRIGHLDHPFADWISIITKTPAETLGLEAGVIKPGATADLILFRARSYTELLSRPQSDRVVLRKGKAIARALPDYRDLDAIVGTPA
jgi:cytosine/creatinine deaminase